MKRKLYDLTDVPFAMFLDRVGNVLNSEEIQHNIVGGVASQAYILNMLSRKYNQSVVDLIHNPDVRVQDYVRKTDDVDVALSLKGEDSEKMERITTKILPRLNYKHKTPDRESNVEFRTERIGASKPRFRVYVNNLGSEEDVIAMNIGRKPEDLYKLDLAWYDEFLRQGEEVFVPYSDNFELKLRVPRLEHLLASKISQSRAKDLMDNKNLAMLVKDTGLVLDFDELHKILYPNHQDNYTRFLSEEFPMEKVSN